MPEFIESYSLKQYNSFGIDARARYFVNCINEEEITDAIHKGNKQGLPFLILGGGSNILFTGDFDGLVIRAGHKGIEKIEEDSEMVLLRAKAGEDWDQFVDYCVKQGYRGIENLSAIPGNVGSSPIQNIGAYGMEVRESVESVEILDLESLQKRYISNEDCKFGYRDSIFKQSLKGKFVILSVNFLLSKKADFILNYGNVEEELKKYNKINLLNVRDAITAIRKRKLPDPAVIGNAGSFFKNPVVPAILAIKIKKEYPRMPHFVYGQRKAKIPAAWLIEQCGWKGKKTGAVGVHENQPLVIVNHGNAKGKDILELATKVKESVKEKFEIELEFEVNIV